MAKLLGDDAYKAARSQTTKKLDGMRGAFIAIAKEGSTNVQSSRFANVGKSVAKRASKTRAVCTHRTKCTP